MLETILKLYTMYMACDVRSPMPHLYGPPGCGKSTAVEQAAEVLGVNLHIINVSRLSPLEVEGVQMPHGHGEEMILRMLPATFWTQLKAGDILLLDEFLRGFPEVYNGLLDILTARRAGAFYLPRVFIIGASNSTIAYDKALEDRLLHIPATDPRKVKGEKDRLAKLIVEALGLHPEMWNSTEMNQLLDHEVLPMFNMLDTMGRGGTSPVGNEGHSVRNLIGQAQLRHVQSAYLSELIDFSNRRAMREGKPQFVFLIDGKRVDPKYAQMMDDIPKSKLTDLQRLNYNLNNQLIELEVARSEKEGTADGSVPDEPPF